MAATPSIKITKSFTWRGGARQFSNRYHFNGGTPADGSAWQALANAIVLIEKSIFMPAVTIVGATGYGAGSDLPVWSGTYSTVGTGTFSSADACPGEDAAIVRYSTTARSTKNHPVYLFNYWHGVQKTVASAGDTLNAAQKTAMETYATAWITGFSDGTITCVRAGPNGATATARTVQATIAHRDFPH